MNGKTQAVLAGCMVIGTDILMGIEIYLAFVFPKTIAMWNETGKQLSESERAMVGISRLAQLVGLPILAILSLVLAGSLVWLVMAMRKRQAERGKTVKER